jgi:hypothetical protein
MKIAGSISQRHGSADPDTPQKCHGFGTLLYTVLLIAGDDEEQEEGGGGPGC